MLSFISHQYCTTKSKKCVYATKLRTMIHSLKSEEILSFFFSHFFNPQQTFFPLSGGECEKDVMTTLLRSFKNFTLDCTRFFFLINYLHFQTFKHIQSSNRHQFLWFLFFFFFIIAQIVTSHGPSRYLHYTQNFYKENLQLKFAQGCIQCPQRPKGHTRSVARGTSTVP